MKKKIHGKWARPLCIGVWAIFFFSSPIFAKPQESTEKMLTKNNLGKKPDIQFKQRVYDFGTISKGAVVKHKFEYINKGDGVLKIGKVKTSCGCTAALITSKTVGPGEKGEVEATFRSQNFRGRITKKVYVHSNDPDENVIQLLIKGIILEQVKPDVKRELEKTKK